MGPLEAAEINSRTLIMKRRELMIQNYEACWVEECLRAGH